MIGELASAIPAEGGFYVWVRRALGPFWGYQESWLSLSASIFDMAIYPAIFVLYLGKLLARAHRGWHGYGWSLAVVVLCCAWNLRGAPAVGDDSVGLFVLAAGAVCGLRGSRLLAWVHAAPRRAMERTPASGGRLSQRRSWSPCGTTWAGTTPPPWPRKWRIRSATIPAP